MRGERRRYRNKNEEGEARQRLSRAGGRTVAVIRYADESGEFSFELTKMRAIACVIFFFSFGENFDFVDDRFATIINEGKRLLYFYAEIQQE